MYLGYQTETDRINAIIARGGIGGMTDLELLETEINKWKNSPKRLEQIRGAQYYDGLQDIRFKKREAVGSDGEMEEVKFLPNRKDIDNQYAIAVNKKANYMLGRPIVWDSKNKQYTELLTEVLGRKFMLKIKNLAKMSMNGGIAWMMPYLDDGKLKFNTYPAHEVLPFWNDYDHEDLDSVVRIYEVITYEGRTEKTVERAEWYKQDGVYRYVLQNGHLVPDVELGEFSPYVVVGGIDYHWERLPMIPFKYNHGETPLIRRAKSLQDAINEMLSMFHNNMLEDSRSAILVIKNYDGQNLGEFRHNLAVYGAVKVRTEGNAGGMDAIQVEINAENFKAILEILKATITENMMSFDGKLLRSGTPNQMNIMSMYEDIEMDTNDFEAEYQAAIEDMLYFINTYLALTGKGDFFEEKVEAVFNRSMLMNETEIMNTLISAGVEIPNELLLGRVPWINDVKKAMDLLAKQKQAAMDAYGDAFGETPDKDGKDADGEEEGEDGEE